MDEEGKKVSNAKFSAKRDEDFELWSTRVEAYLVAKGVFEVVSNDKSQAFDEDGIIAKSMASARSIVIQALGDKPLRTVMAERTNPHVMWRKLRERYATSSAATRVQLQTRLQQMNYSTSISMSEYVDRMEVIFNRMEGMGCTIDESMKVAILLASFGDKSVSSYGPVISALETLSDDNLTWETTTSRLLPEYESKSVTRDASAAQNIGQKKFVRALKAKTNVICYSCGKKWHFARDFFAKKKSQDRDFDSGAKAHEAVRHHFALVTKSCHRIKTIIDSGASSHMVADMRFMKGPMDTVDHRIVLGDGRVVKSTTSGRAVIDCKGQNGQAFSFELSNVLYVPNLDTNLLSCSKLDENGHEIRFKSGECTLRPAHEDGFFKIGYRRSGVYQLTGIFQAQEECKTASSTEKITERVWHNRLEHIAESTIRDAVRKGPARGIELHGNGNLKEKCGHCLHGKQTRLFLKERSSKATHPGEIIHSDVCGPMPIQTIAGKRYFVSFIDGFTGFKSIYLLSKKSEVPDRFMEFAAHFERRNECIIKGLYSDNGGEYEGMHDHLREQGIEVVRSAPYTPEQNGVAERANRTLMNMVRSMLSHSGLPTSFWGEALAYATDMCNSIGSRRNAMRSSNELLSGNVPYIGHLRTFGCQVMVHVPQQLRNKLQNRSREGTLLRGLPHSLLRVWYSDTKSVQHVRHVVVSENNFPARQWKNVSRPSVQDLEWIDELFPIKDSDRFESYEGEDSELEGSIDAGNDPLNSITGGDELPPAPPMAELTYTPANASSDTTVVDTGEQQRYPTRDRRNPDRLAYRASEVNLEIGLTNDQPSLEEALAGSDADMWRAAIDSELTALEVNKTWSNVRRDQATSRPLDTKMVLKVKRHANGEVDKYKARLVVKGFQQQVDDGIYAPVVDFSSIRVACALTWMKGGQVHQMDVSSAFLNGTLEGSEPVYIEPPTYLGPIFDETTVLKLEKALYGLKIAPRAWNCTWNRLVKTVGFVRMKADTCVYRRGEGSNEIWVLMYVDDILVMGCDEKSIQSAKTDLCTLFSMKDMGVVKFFLGVEFTTLTNRVLLKQTHYINRLLRQFHMVDCKPVSTLILPGQNWALEDEETAVVPYKEAIGALLFLSTRTRPDISFAVSLLPRYTAAPQAKHWTGVKRILRYLKGTSELGLQYMKNQSFQGGDLADFLHASSDADWASSLEDRKSTSGMTLFIGENIVSWKTRKQKSVALSTSEAEYMALSECVREVRWMRELLRELGLFTASPTCIEEDNSGAIAWSASEKTAKHVSIRYHFVQDMVREGAVSVKYCPTRYMSADIMTKALAGSKFVQLRDLLCMHSARSSNEIAKEEIVV